MPFSKLPKSTQSGIRNKAKKHHKSTKSTSKKWFSVYEKAKKEYGDKSTAAKVAYAALNKEGTILDLFSPLFEASPPGMQGMDRPAKMQSNPSVDVLGKQLQKLVAELNQAQDPHQKAQIASQMQQLLNQIATGAPVQSQGIKRGGI